MHVDSPKLLWDAQQAVERIARFTDNKSSRFTDNKSSRFTDNKSFSEYEADELLRSAVERQFEIVGEAMNRLARVDPGVAAEIPELPRIVSFGNVLIHGYASVDHRLVWGVIEAHLDALRAALERLLGRLAA
jgi:uncharacterized protein with HEPN domain